jgi:hypothetical protein
MLDATNDVTIGAIENYGWREVEPYAVSLSRVGFKGDKIMFVKNISAECFDRLKQMGFELLEVPNDSYFTKGFFLKRFMIAREYLLRRQKSGKPVRYVFATDYRDVVFQTNPSTWMELHKNEAKIIIGSEKVKIKDEPGAVKWAKHILGDEMYEEIKEEEVLNSGTIAGECDALCDLFLRIYELGIDTKEWGWAQSDQTVLNWIVRQSPFKEITRVPKFEENFAAVVCCAISGRYNDKLTEPCPEMIKGIVYAADEIEPFCILHQYQGRTEWIGAVDKRYREFPDRMSYHGDGDAHNMARLIFQPAQRAPLHRFDVTTEGTKPRLGRK